MLTEADFENKKARINRKMAGLLYLNLINANIWLEDYDRVALLMKCAASTPRRAPKAQPTGWTPSQRTNAAGGD